MLTLSAGEVCGGLSDEACTAGWPLKSRVDDGGGVPSLGGGGAGGTRETLWRTKESVSVEGINHFGNTLGILPWRRPREIVSRWRR